MTRPLRASGALRRRTLVATALLAATALPVSAGARELPNFDALRSAPHSVAPSPEARALPLAATGGGLAPKLGVPAFLSAREARAALAASGAPLARRTQVTDDTERARGYLRDVAALYRLDAAQVDALALSHAAKVPGGGALARFRTEVDGIEVWREEATVLLDARGDLVAIGGYVTGTPAGARALPSIETRTAAIGVVLAEQGFGREVTTQLVSMREEAGYQWITLPDGMRTADGATLAAPMRVKRVWYRLPDALVPAWFVEVQVQDPASSHGLDAYSYVIGAHDNAVLFRNNLVTDAAFNYRVYAESTPPFLPLPGPAGRAGFPHPTGQPDGWQPPIQARNLVTLQNAPFSRNDPWLADLANRTQGNNVEAFTNILEGDGYGPPGTDECNLSLPVDGDLHACTTSTQTFDHTYDHAAMPNANRMQVNSVVTNLFYTINYLHDWFYDAGFDEAARNAQTNNFNRGGIGSDSIFAEAQDYSGNNNASMFTPADGQRPRMRMYLWTSSVSLAKVTAPPAVAGVKASNTATFGPQAFDLSGSVVLAQDAADANGALTTDGCSPLTNAAAVAGKIALIDRGTCTFVVKAANAQAAGAQAVLIVNNVAPGAPGMSGDDPSITIPVSSVSLDDGNAIKAQLAAGVAMRLARQASLPRDGSFDNTVVAHEWGHYLTNRLVGNANGLNANHAGGMGEGWSDFVAMLLMVKESDRNAAAPNFGGTYGITPYPLGGPDFAPDVLNNAYYYGLRRYPYTRDMSKNPLTFRHIANDQPLPATPAMNPRGSSAANAEVHNAGEVWAAMLWECYSNLLNDSGRLTFDQAQERMKRYLVTGLKLTPVDPTFVNARDALLAAMQAQDATDHDLCLAGFAKRGLGVGAVAPDNLSETNIGVVESFRTTAAGPGTKVQAIEYYHAAFDHYFVTSIADEITKLDNGTFAGWARTGESFAVYADTPLGASVVCRFFSTAFGPRSSHFYTPSASECTTVKANPSWQFEGEVFSSPTPDATGACAAGTPVYRLYNNGQGAAPNHRYTTSLATRATMLGKGWIAEGSGVGVIMCAP